MYLYSLKQMKTILSNLLLLSLPLLVQCFNPPSGNIRLGDMDCQYEIVGTDLIISLSAPTNGWLAIGFNDENNIVGSDLIMMCVKFGKVQFEDQYVKGTGDNPLDTSLGGQSNIEILAFSEANGQTNISLKRPLVTKDKFDFKHQTDKDFWLILAYSVSDDFDHHSIMRKHAKIKWSE